MTRRRPNKPTQPAAATHDADRLFDRFELAWQNAGSPRIEDFLPPGTPAGRGLSHAGLLFELVRIDLEYRWRRPGEARGPLGSRPLLEAYAGRLPALGPAGRLPVEMITEEYRVRQRWGDRPGHAEYERRFPRHGTALKAALALVDADLEAELATSRPRGHAPRVRSYGSTSPAQGEEYLGVAVAARPPAPSLGRYDLADLLGAGAFGTVWRAWDRELAREVAVKLLRAGPPASAAAKERFLREARSAAHLRHPGIVAVHDVGEERGALYIVSELVRGASLADRLRGGRLGPGEAAGLVADVADALDYAHRRGVVHRDVKPSNILLEGAQSGGAAGRPRLTDFGLALREAGEVTMTVDGQLLGTPAYMSPEQARAPHAVDGRSDVYSLGVILYELLTGQLPFDGTPLGLLHQAAVGEPVPPSRLNKRVPRDLEAVCLTCLAKGPDVRYQTAGVLAADLRRWLAGEPVRARAAGRVARLWLWVKRNPALAGTGALGAVAFVAVAGAPVAGALVAATTAALLFALHRAKVAADLSRQVEGILQDQKRAAAAVRFALRHCAQARQQRDRAAAAEARATGQARAAGQFAREVIFDLPDLLPTGRKHRAARAYLARAALAYLDRLADGAEGDAVLLRDLALAYAQVGDTLEAESPAACPAALACHVKALRIFTPLAGSRPNNTQAQRDLAACRRRVAELDRKARSGGLSPFSVSAGERKTECTNRE